MFELFQRKNTKKSNDRWTEKKAAKHQDMEKRRRKKEGHQWAVCLGIKEDKSNQRQEMSMGEMCVGEMYYLDPEVEEPTFVTLH